MPCNHTTVMLTIGSLLLLPSGLAWADATELKAKRAAPSGDRAVVSAGNGFYTVYVEDTSGVGLYTATTGPLHPAGNGLNVFFGDGFPGTSYNTIRSYTSGTDYVQSISGPTSSNTVVALDPFGSVTTIGSTGYRTTYVVSGADDLTIVSDVNVNGTTFEDSTIEVTTTVTNDGAQSVDIGIRYLWDYQIGIDDGPTFQEINPNGIVRILESEFSSPGFVQYRIRDNDSNPFSPTFLVFGTVTGPPAVVPTPTAPDLLQYACWPVAFGSAFDHTVDPLRDIGTPASPCTNIGGDSAVNYYFGDDAGSAITLGAGEDVTVSASVFLLPSPYALSVPVASGWGLAALAGLLLGSILLALRRVHAPGG